MTIVYIETVIRHPHHFFINFSLIFFDSPTLTHKKLQKHDPEFVCLSVWFSKRVTEPFTRFVWRVVS